jgi:DNA-binding transcriptional LysR family regulator
VAVAELHSFSAAASALGVSQPTVSVQLAALEAACGVLLLRRKPQLALTEAGQDLFVRARLALSRVDEFAASAKDLRAMQRGHMTIGLSTPHVALPLMAAFMKRHPNIAVTATVGNTAELLEGITRCRIDVGVMTLVEQPQHLACTLVCAPRLQVCMRKDDPLSTRASLRPFEVADRPFVLREEGSMTRVVLEAKFAAEKVPLNPGVVLPNREAMKEAVAAGLGLGALFDAELGFDNRLVGVPFATVPHAHGIYAVALAESLDIPSVRAFIDGIPRSSPGVR